MHIYISL